MASFTPPFILNLPNELLLKIALIASERNKWGGPAVHRWPSSLFWNDRPHDLVMARNLCLVNRRFRDIGREVLYADIEFMPEYEASEQSISYLVRTLDEIPSLKQLIKRVILYASSPLSYQKAHKLLLDVTPDLRSFAVYSQDFYFLENQDVQEFWSTCRTFSPNIGKLQLSGINHTQLAGLVSFWDSFASLKSLNLRLELESPLQPGLDELNLKLELDKMPIRSSSLTELIITCHPNCYIGSNRLVVTKLVQLARRLEVLDLTFDEEEFNYGTEFHTAMVQHQSSLSNSHL